MTNQEILTKAIQKAIDGGFNPGASENGEPAQVTFTRRMMQDLFFRQALIYNHDFAKALWGKGKPKEMTYFSTGTKYTNHVKGWKHHLQQMVIAEDPIKYLGDNL